MTATLPSHRRADRPTRKARSTARSSLPASSAPQPRSPTTRSWTSTGPPRSLTHLYGLSPEWSTLYGTPLWDGLTEEQRVTLTIHEYCSISGVGIWFECLLMQLMLRDIYGDDPAQPHVQWALTEIADECRHSVMFARTAETFGAPSYQPPTSILRLGQGVRGQGATGRPPTRRSWSPRRSSTSSSAT